MEAFQARVIDEKVDIAIKLDKLRVFCRTATFEALPPEEKDRLMRQRDAMDAYSSILSERIAAF